MDIGDIIFWIFVLISVGSSIFGGKKKKKFPPRQESETEEILRELMERGKLEQKVQEEKTLREQAHGQQSQPQQSREQRAPREEQVRPVQREPVVKREPMEQRMPRERVVRRVPFNPPQGRNIPERMHDPLREIAEGSYVDRERAESETYEKATVSPTDEYAKIKLVAPKLVRDEDLGSQYQSRILAPEDDHFKNEGARVFNYTDDLPSDRKKGKSGKSIVHKKFKFDPMDAVIYTEIMTKRY